MFIGAEFTASYIRRRIEVFAHLATSRPESSILPTRDNPSENAFEDFSETLTN